LRVLEYNVLRDGDRWGWEHLTVPRVPCLRRAEILDAMIDGYDADMIGFCERYDCWEDDGRLTARLAEKGYAVVENSIPEDLRRTWQHDHPDRDFNRNLIAYRSDRFTLLRSFITDIQAFPSVNYRSFTAAILRDRVTERVLVAVDTHWESQGDKTRTADECRMMNAERMVAKLTEILKEYPDAPVLAMGDFNAVAENPAYRRLLEGCALSDTLEGAGTIDHVAYRGCRLLGWTSDEAPYTGYLSDHKPYCAEYAL
jgi:hypothetical protein